MIAGSPKRDNDWYRANYEKTDSHMHSGMCKMNDKNTILTIGYDQCISMRKGIDHGTGIVVQLYHVTGGGQVLYATTARGMLEIREKSIEICGLYPGIKIVSREEGFIHATKSADAGLEIERSGGWVEMIAAFLWPEAERMRFTATVWRKMVHGKVDMSGVEDKPAAWKEVSMKWAISDPSGLKWITNHNEADARGIGSAGGQLWYRGDLKK